MPATRPRLSPQCSALRFSHSRRAEGTILFKLSSWPGTTTPSAKSVAAARRFRRGNAPKPPSTLYDPPEVPAAFALEKKLRELALRRINALLSVFPSSSNKREDSRISAHRVTAAPSVLLFSHHPFCSFIGETLGLKGRRHTASE